ncbi:GtrA family protein [Myxococcota bacterium]|nr:GtrA family protein [Myxococcota bacterium]MBU1900297.1 GtrA family protein [Myxococcota bacterium]
MRASALRGEMHTEPIIYSLGPAMMITAYFGVGLLLYGARRALIGPYRDAEMEARGDSALLVMGLRRYFYWLIQPPFHLLRWLKLPPNAITTLSGLISISSGVAFAAGRFSLGGWLYIFSGILDVFDGRLARAMGRASAQGAALDSILDRYADAVVLAGLAWFYRDSWVLVAVLVALSGSLLTSYVRAKGEALGLEVKGGMMQRPERIVSLGITTAFAPFLEALYPHTPGQPAFVLAVLGLVFLAVSSQSTAASRFIYVLRALDQGRDGQARLLGAQRGGLPRALTSAFAATGADFLIVTALVSFTGLMPWWATAIGCAVGALINFTINRRWAFEPADAPVTLQAGRYVFVSGLSLALNAGGVAVLLLLPDLDYRLAWILARGAVFLFWNFPLHRDYVFAPR